MPETRLFIGLFGLFLVASGINGEWHDDAGPWVVATKGEPWPLPASRNLYNEYYRLLRSFQFEIMDESCEILLAAIDRYKEIILNELRVSRKFVQDVKQSNNIESFSYVNNLSIIKIQLNNPCEHYPHLTSNESYILNIPENDNSNKGLLIADSIWGILRGLETFSQLITYSKNESGHLDLVIKKQIIIDQPKLPHRGLLIDTSRHYLPVADILLTLDAMSYNKLNVLHWHIVDDNSFPYKSDAFPELSNKGAYHSTMIYHASHIQEIIEYARLRGIRVLPEFDTPGHTKSWGLSHPEFLTPCYDSDGKATGKLGPMNPTKESLYPFLNNLLKEVKERFPDEHMHLGGDEVPYDCWSSNPEIKNFMQKNNISERFDKLEELYVQRLLDIVAKLNIKPIVWQEVFDNGVKIHEGTVVHIWTGNWQDKMTAVTAAGHPALLSTCWYLDHLATGGDWINFYKCDPLDFSAASIEQKHLVLGGEACMWGEFVDRNNIHSRIWPRASAAAERLWSIENQDQDVVAQRLEEHACRMNRRGIPAQPPNGPGFCLV